MKNFKKITLKTPNIIEKGLSAEQLSKLDLMSLIGGYVCIMHCPSNNWNNGGSGGSGGWNNPCGGYVCAVDACGVAACGGDMCTAAGCGGNVCGGNACGGWGTGDTCGGDACVVAGCGGNACGGNACVAELCPWDNCLVDACWPVDLF